MRSLPLALGAALTACAPGQHAGIKNLNLFERASTGPSFEMDAMSLVRFMTAVEKQAALTIKNYEERASVCHFSVTGWEPYIEEIEVSATITMGDEPVTRVFVNFPGQDSPLAQLSVDDSSRTCSIAYGKDPKNKMEPWNWENTDEKTGKYPDCEFASSAQELCENARKRFAQVSQAQ
ncbi:hypothetical protein IPG41_03450 [Candidatus Peregrinibacteria bacterium]|nr:MAG: hypothetical protein IPG41_03450 [Candidatus Peregrinibacteria bacterium]